MKIILEASINNCAGNTVWYGRPFTTVRPHEGRVMRVQDHTHTHTRTRVTIITINSALHSCVANKELKRQVHLSIRHWLVKWYTFNCVEKDYRNYCPKHMCESLHIFTTHTHCSTYVSRYTSHILFENELTNVCGRTPIILQDERNAIPLFGSKYHLVSRSLADISNVSSCINKENIICEHIRETILENTFDSFRD